MAREDGDEDSRWMLTQVGVRRCVEFGDGNVRGTTYMKRGYAHAPPIPRPRPAATSTSSLEIEICDRMDRLKAAVSRSALVRHSR